LLAGKELPVASLEGQLGGLAHPFQWPPVRRRKRTVAAADATPSAPRPRRAPP
jgi:hypothetical protein